MSSPIRVYNRTQRFPSLTLLYIEVCYTYLHITINYLSGEKKLFSRMES